MKVPDSTDRRVMRTRATLREALITLIQQRGWDDISVQDVCDQANIGRSTFYTHFADKEELLLVGFDALRRGLREIAQSGVLGDKAIAFSGALLAHAHDNLRIFRVLAGKRTGEVVRKHFRQLVLDLTKEELLASLATGPRLDATAHYISGGFLELMAWWVDLRKPIQPEALDTIFQQLTRPVLAAARTASRQATNRPAGAK